MELNNSNRNKKNRKRNLMLIERYMAEKIAQGRMNLVNLKKETNIDQSIIESVVNKLIKENLVRFNNEIYSINTDDSESWSEINSKENTKLELNELFESFLDYFFSSKEKISFSKSKIKNNEIFNETKEFNTLGLKKHYLKNDEVIVLNSLLNKIDMFFKEVDQQRREEKLKKKEVNLEEYIVFWGGAKYSNIVHHLINH